MRVGIDARRGPLDATRIVILACDENAAFRQAKKDVARIGKSNVKEHR